MGKKQEQQNQKNKGHKTLRDKLRKKRQQLKKHKKQKSEKHKQYDTEQQKKKYFEQESSKKKKRQDGIKEHKLKKYIQRFVDIYEDDVDDFYGLFQTLDQGGSIDIAGVADPKMQKCLKKMFKYLPLKKNKMEYEKKEGAETKLKTLMKQLVTKSIDNYLQNGTDNEEYEQQNSEKQSSQDNEGGQKVKDKKKKSKKTQQKQVIDLEQQKRKKAQIEKQNLREYESLNLYSQKIIQQPKPETIGPFISAEQRQMLSKMFNQQQKINMENVGHAGNDNQNNQFQRIFAMSAHSKRNQPQGPPKPSIDDIPDQLLAQGSAKIGQKQEIDPEQIQEYNKIHRPRKLIEEHQQMMKLGKYAQTDKDGKKKRVPFDRERDIVYGRSRQSKNEGVFYDFSQRMTKPKSTNNFL